MSKAKGKKTGMTPAARTVATQRDIQALGMDARHGRARFEQALHRIDLHRDALEAMPHAAGRADHEIVDFEGGTEAEPAPAQRADGHHGAE